MALSRAIYLPQAGMNGYEGIQHLRAGNNDKAFEAFVEMGFNLVMAGLGQCFVAGTQVVVRVAPDGTVSAETPSNDYFLGNAVLAASLVVIAVQGRRRILNARRRDERDEELDEAFATWNGDGPDAEVDEDPSARGMAMSVAVAVQSPQPNIDQTQPLAIAVSKPQAAVGPAAAATTARPGIAPKARGSRLRMRPVLALTWLCAFMSLAGWFGYRALPDNVTASAFAHETPVTPATPRYVTKNIEDIKPGEVVLAVDPKTGDRCLRPVVDAFSRTSDHIRVLTFSTPDAPSQTIRTTDEHPFWIPAERAWIKASDLLLGDVVVGPAGEMQILEGTDRECYPGGVTVYNFEVAEAHCYFVSETIANSPVLVHNAKGQRCSTGSSPEYARNFDRIFSPNYRNFDFGRLLRNAIGSPKPGMLNPHAHHILFKYGLGRAQRELVREGQGILRGVGIDPILGIENLVWAPNKIRGQHSFSALSNVVKELRKLQAAGGDYDDFVELLKSLGKIAATRT